MTVNGYLSSLFLLICLASHSVPGSSQNKVARQPSLPSSHELSPLVVTMGSKSVVAGEAVVKIGLLAYDTLVSMELDVQNVSKKPVEVDVFHLGDGLLADWSLPNGETASRVTIGSGDHHALHVRLMASKNEVRLPSLTFMSRWEEIGHVDFLYLPIAVPPDHTIPFGGFLSGVGEASKDYRFCTGTSPPGLEIAKAVPRVVQGDLQVYDPRNCANTWATCPSTPAIAPGEGVCFAPSVQGHHEGHDQSHDRAVPFNFFIDVGYRPAQPAPTLETRPQILGAKTTANAN